MILKLEFLLLKPSKGRELHCANGTSFLLAIMLVDLFASLYLHFVEHSNGTVINTVYSSWNNEHLKNVNCKSIQNRLTLIHIYLLHVFIKFFAFLSNLFHLIFYTNIIYSYLLFFFVLSSKKKCIFLKIKFYIEWIIRTVNVCLILFQTASKFFFFSTNQKCLYLFKLILVK